VTKQTAANPPRIQARRKAGLFRFRNVEKAAPSAALQDLAELVASRSVAPASWSASTQRRFENRHGLYHRLAARQPGRSGLQEYPKMIVRVVPRTSYWFAGLLLAPAAGVVLTAVIIRPLLLLFGLDLVRGPLIAVMGGVTLATAGWIYCRDYWRVCYELWPDALVLGRGSGALIIAFREIESIVQGLPDRLPWILRLIRFSPFHCRKLDGIVQTRAHTLLLRLTRNRYLPLNTHFVFLQNGSRLMAEFLRLNQDRVVGRETYSAREITGLSLVTANRLKRI
jgi:hypothetical protein